jgi:hypothetical protein
LAGGPAGYNKRVTVMAVSRRPAWNAPRWVAVNLAWFVGTWVVVGAVYAAAIMISEGDGFAAPPLTLDLLTWPFTILVFALLSAFAAAVGLMLFGLVVAPGLGVYLLTIWWVARVVPERWRRAAAIALSPLIPALVLLGSDWVDFELAMLAGSAAYGAVLRLP